MTEKKSNILTKKVLGWAACANMCTYFAAALWLGGDALNGKVINGHYFLGNHGIYTEVSHGVFVYSYIHTCCFLAMWPFIIWANIRAKPRDEKAQISN